MNTSGEILFRESSAPFLQDKNAPRRVPVALAQPSLPLKTAREEGSTPKKHSTKRQTVQAAGWIDPDTDSYIQHRLLESKKNIDPKFTRSKVVAQMLRERAQDDTFQRNQQILVPIIQDTMRSMHRDFENRYLSVIAKIAYQVGWILSLLIRYMSFRLDEKTLHDIETGSEKDGRIYVTQRTPQTEEVKNRVRQLLEER